VLDYSRLERLASDKHSSLLGPFVSYEENESEKQIETSNAVQCENMIKAYPKARGSTRAGSGLTRKHKTTLERLALDIRCSLL
jgi:hypothetical protein